MSAWAIPISVQNLKIWLKEKLILLSKDFPGLLLHFFVIQSNFESGRISSFASSQYNSCPSGRILKKKHNAFCRKKEISDAFRKTGIFTKVFRCLRRTCLFSDAQNLKDALFCHRYQIVAKVSKAILHNVQMEHYPVLGLNKPS